MDRVADVTSRTIDLDDDESHDDNETENLSDVTDHIHDYSRI